MTTELRALIDSLTCRRCQGEGVLHSRATKYVGEVWETHRECDVCDGRGVTLSSLETPS